MNWRIARRAVAAAMVLCIVVIAGGFAFLHLPALEQTRSRIGAALLSSYLGEAVVVTEGVAVTFGPTIDVAVHGVAPVTGVTDRPAPVGRVRLSFATDAALRGRLDLTALELAGVRVVVDAGMAEPSKDPLGERVSRSVQGFLSSRLVRSLEIEDLRILRINDPAGWNGTLLFESASSRETNRAGLISIDAKGSLNGQAFTLSGTVPDLSPASGAARDDTVSLKLAFNSMEAALDGRLAQGSSGITLAALFNANSPSLGDVQEALGLARAVEGGGTLDLTVDGALARLAIGSAKLRIGSPEGRVYRVDGSVAGMWTLALRDYAVDGRFRLDMSGVLTGRRDLTSLGALRGTVALSDASGAPRLEKLDAKLTGTDLMSLSLRLAESGTSGTGVGLKLRVPDLALLASALGDRASAGVQIACNGVIGADDAVTARGSAKVGKADLDGWLRIAARAGKSRITGSIHAKELHLDDLIAAREVSDLVPKRVMGAVTLREDIRDQTTLSLDLAADAVEGAGQQTGGLTARLVYARSRLRVAPLELAYLGGHIKAHVQADLAPSPLTLALNAEARRLSLAQMFSRLGQAPAAAGPLDLDLSVTTKGADLWALLASLNGQVSGSIRGGSLADRTINLAGQNIVEWMFTRTADGSAPLECFAARFDFADGNGTARQLVFETDKVQVIGGGTLNLRDETMHLVFTPRPKTKRLIGKVGSVDVSGPVSAPEVSLAEGAVAAKVVGDTIALPFHLLGSILRADGQLLPEHQPCVIVPDGK
jgi:hypothetical protein